MTDIETEPVKQVVSLLREGGFRAIQSPVLIGGVPFEFPAVLVGSDRTFDIAVVVDTVSEEDRRLRQKIDALARALDTVGSRRPLNLVIVGPTPDFEVVAAMSRVARVLIVRSGDATQGTGSLSIRDALAVLLPLKLPPSTAETPEPFRQVEEWLTSKASRAPMATLVDAARSGPKLVQSALTEVLREPLMKLDLEDSM